jgi:hypothetical protein
VLDRQADELVEDSDGQVGNLLRGDVQRRVGKHGVRRIGVSPADVGPDVQRPIRPLGKCRVLVAGKIGEGRAGDLDELKLAAL